MTTNKQLLDEYIDRSGYRINHICKQLGITPQSFGQKRRNVTRFKAAEIHTLCDLLHIKEEDKDTIFLP